MEPVLWVQPQATMELEDKASGDELALQLIIGSASGRVAVINGRKLRTGEQIQGLQLMSVNDRSVDLSTSAGSKQRLYLPSARLQQQNKK